jgi:DNA-binding transcriptional LysR family regulator
MLHADVTLSEISAFIEVAQAQSFSRAAEKLGTNKSQVGKHVQRLEKRLGTRLLNRTTRAVNLSEDGQTYLEAAKAALQGLQEAELALAARKSEPVGKVRISLPMGLGSLFLPALSVFSKQHPKMSLELALSEKIVDPIGEGWDIVVRVGDPSYNSESSAHHLGRLCFGLFASPEYLSARGLIRSIDDLSNHDAIMQRCATQRLWSWPTQNAHQKRSVRSHPLLTLADDQLLLDAAMSNFGVARMFERVARPYVDAGKLIPVLPEVDTGSIAVHAFIAAGHRMNTKTRIVLNTLGECIKS